MDNKEISPLNLSFIKILSRVWKFFFFIISPFSRVVALTSCRCYRSFSLTFALSPSGKAHDFDSCIHWFKSSKGSFVALQQRLVSSRLNKPSDRYKVVSSIQILRLHKEFDRKHIQSMPSLRLQETVSVGVTWLGRCSETVGTVLTQKCGERLVGIRHKNRKFKCLIYYRQISYSKELVGIYEAIRQQGKQDGDEWVVFKRCECSNVHLIVQK